MTLNEFKVSVGIKGKTNQEHDLILCSTCKSNMGIKKWAAVSTKESIRCPMCGAIVMKDSKVNVVNQKPKRIKFIDPTKSRASVEVRPDGTKLYKEEIHVQMKQKITKI